MSTVSVSHLYLCGRSLFGPAFLIHLKDQKTEIPSECDTLEGEICQEAVAI